MELDTLEELIKGLSPLARAHAIYGVINHAGSSLYHKFIPLVEEAIGTFEEHAMHSPNSIFSARAGILATCFNYVDRAIAIYSRDGDFLEVVHIMQSAQMEIPQEMYEKAIDQDENNPRNIPLGSRSIDDLLISAKKWERVMELGISSNGYVRMVEAAEASKDNQLMQKAKTILSEQGFAYYKERGMYESAVLAASRIGMKTEATALLDEGIDHYISGQKLMDLNGYPSVNNIFDLVATALDEDIKQTKEIYKKLVNFMIQTEEYESAAKITSHVGLKSDEFPEFRKVISGMIEKKEYIPAAKIAKMAAMGGDEIKRIFKEAEMILEDEGRFHEASEYARLAGRYARAKKLDRLDDLSKFIYPSKCC